MPSASQRLFPWAQASLARLQTSRRFPLCGGAASRRQRANIVAIIEEHCSAAPDWLHQALAAFKQGQYGAVGGAIIDYDYDRLRDWVVYFLEYNGALPPDAEG